MGRRCGTTLEQRHVTVSMLTGSISPFWSRPICGTTLRHKYYLVYYHQIGAARNPYRSIKLRPNDVIYARFMQVMSRHNRFGEVHMEALEFSWLLHELVTNPSV